MTAATLPSGGASLPMPPRRDDALPRGTRLEGCVIESVLAESGLSIVYRARAPDGARLIAIKEYLPVALAIRGGDGFSVAPRAPAHAATFAAGLAAFHDEAQLLARCQHPSLLPVLGVWRAHGTIYRVMPLLEGSTLLAQRAAMADAPDEAAVRRLLDALCGALQMLHGAGLAHGDVAPGNILLRAEDGRPVLMDTGAVRRAVLGDDTRALMAMLEPAYACDVSLATADPQRADLCALAAVAAFWITGRMPAAAVAGGPPPLAAAVQAMQVHKPALHYGAALVAAVDAVLAGSGVAAARSVDEFRRALLGRAAPVPVQAMRGFDLGQLGMPRAGPVPSVAAPTVRAPNVVSAAGAAAAPMSEPRAVAPAHVPAATPAPARAAPAATTAPVPPAPAAMPFERVRVETRRGYPQRANSHGGRWAAVAVVAFVLVVGGWVFQQQRAAFQDRAARAAAAQREAVAAAAARELANAPPAAGPAAPPSGPASAARNAAAAARPTKPANAKTVAPPTSPRAACGERTPFSLYRCMQAECRKPQWAQHSQCIKMSRSGIVD